MPLPFLYGAILGLSQFLATLIVYAFGLHGDAAKLERAQFVESLLGFIFLMLVIGAAHRATRVAAKARGQDAIPFGAAAKFAAATALVGGLATGLGQYAYLAFINPALRELQRAQILERAKDKLAAFTPEQIAESTRQIDYATSAGARGLVYGLNTFLFATLLGIAFALIFKAAVRRDKKTAGS